MEMHLECYHIPMRSGIIVYGPSQSEMALQCNAVWFAGRIHRMIPGSECLTHQGLVTHICIINLSYHWFGQWLVAWLAQSHILNQCRLIVYWTFRNKFQKKLTIFIQRNAFENVCKMSAILFRPQCVNLELWLWPWIFNGHCVIFWNKARTQKFCNIFF